MRTTWINSNFTALTTTVVDGFTIYRLDREDVGGGGVTVYVRHSLNAKILVHSDPHFDNTSEYLFIEIRHNHNVLLFTVIHRCPHIADPTRFFNILATLQPTYSDIVITEDFHMNIFANSRDSTYLQNQIVARALFLVLSSPIHHAACVDPWTDTLMDLFIIQNRNALVELKKQYPRLQMDMIWPRLTIRSPSHL